MGQKQRPTSADGLNLPVLRAMIDAVDRDILQLLARRSAIVGEIAQYKREHRIGIRDFERERSILDDRRDRAARLGLSPEVVESMYRLVLWASRDRQAELRAEMPLDIESRAVAVIGGRGAMGRMMGELFADLSHTVMIADVDTELTPRQAAAAADVVIVSVPIEQTESVIRDIGPHVRSGALLADVTSTKSAPLAAMLDATDADVLGMHPLFGPGVHSLQGQRVVLTPGRGDEWLAWMKSMLAARGILTLETTAERHDSAMAVVQVLVHFATEVMGKTLADLKVDIDETLTFTSPIYLMEMLMTARHFGQSPDLYANIQMANPKTDEVTAAFVAAADRLRTAARDRDIDAYRSMFQEVKALFGGFTDQALEQSSFLIDRLVERG